MSIGGEWQAGPTYGVRRVDLRAVMCRSCGHSYPEHYQGAGPCSVWCGCPAFRWVDPTGPAGGYSSRPAAPTR